MRPGQVGVRGWRKGGVRRVVKRAVGHALWACPVRQAREGPGGRQWGRGRACPVGQTRVVAQHSGGAARAARAVGPHRPLLASAAKCNSRVETTNNSGAPLTSSLRAFFSSSSFHTAAMRRCTAACGPGGRKGRGAGSCLAAQPPRPPCAAMVQITGANTGCLSMLRPTCPTCHPSVQPSQARQPPPAQPCTAACPARQPPPASSALLCAPARR